jgi:long-chain acyl-CoA synthetase
MKLVDKEEPIPPLKMLPDELAVIIYTSGTTGVPKGVELSHNNVISNLKDLQVRWEDNLQEKTSLAYLPWAHVFGQTCELHCLIGTGSALGIVEKRELILESIGMIKPSILCSVPVLFNRVFDGVHKKMNSESPLKQKLFHAALKISREKNQLLEEGKSIGAWLNFKHKIVDKIVLSKIRDRLGGNLKLIISGGAAASLPVLQFFEDIGIPICEGYGLTETSPVITAGANNWKTRRLGCVGILLPVISTLHDI